MARAGTGYSGSGVYPLTDKKQQPGMERNVMTRNDRIEVGKHAAVLIRSFRFAAFPAAVFV